MIQYINTKLPKREREIMTMRYGLDKKIPKTQQEVADILGISRSYVSRIETKVQKKLSSILLEE
jgi:RNA polymerase sporulation-specific sigma factor